MGDTLFAKITPCPENGKVAFVSHLTDEIGLGSTEFLVLSPRPGTHPRFLYHLVCTHAVRGRATARMEGSTGRQRVPEEVFTKRLLVPIPSLSEQEEIAQILDAVDTTLECTRAAIERARALRRSLLADLMSRGIGEDGNVRDGAAKAAGFTGTRAGLLPASWKLSTVGAEFDIQNGFTLNAERRTNFVTRRYLRVANVHRDVLYLDDIQLLGATDSEFAPRQLELNDLLVVEGHADRMQIGRCARVTAAAVGMTFQNHLFRLRSVGGVIPAFGCLWLNSSYAQRFWNARSATSSGLNTINQRTLKKLLIPVPSLQEQDKIIEAASVQHQQLEALIRKRDSLDALKRVLLHDLLTGHVRVTTPVEALAS